MYRPELSKFLSTTILKQLKICQPNPTKQAKSIKKKKWTQNPGDQLQSNKHIHTSSHNPSPFFPFLYKTRELKKKPSFTLNLFKIVIKADK